jgi:hypothetical protein
MSSGAEERGAGASKPVRMMVGLGAALPVAPPTVLKKPPCSRSSNSSPCFSVMRTAV